MTAWRTITHIPALRFLAATALAAIALAWPSPAVGDDPPAPPANLTGTVADTSVTLNWDAPDGYTPTGYQILRHHRGTNFPGDFDIIVANTGSTETTYTDTDVKRGARYVLSDKSLEGRNAQRAEQLLQRRRASTGPANQPHGHRNAHVRHPHLGRPGRLHADRLPDTPLAAPGPPVTATSTNTSTTPAVRRPRTPTRT